MCPTLEEYTDESVESIESWKSETITFSGTHKTKITAIEKSNKYTMYINGDHGTRMSREQTILVKKDNLWKYVKSMDIVSGDIVVLYKDGNFIETEVNQINYDNSKTHEVYLFDVEETDIFIAGNIVVHNYKSYAV